MPPDDEEDDLPLFEPEADTTYSVEMIAQLSGVTNETILHYKEEGLIMSAGTESSAFPGEALRTVRRIEYLRARSGANTAGLKLLLSLMDEVERLRDDLRSRR